MKYFVSDPELDQLYKKHADDAGFDIKSAESLTIADGDWHLIKTGLHVAIPKGCVGILKPRSGLSLLFNTDIHAGVLDSNYRGEVGVLISANNLPFTINKGDRIAQLVLLVQPKVELERVNSLEELDATDRGVEGFGSTGGFA